MGTGVETDRVRETTQTLVDGAEVGAEAETGIDEADDTAGVGVEREIETEIEAQKRRSSATKESQIATRV